MGKIFVLNHTVDHLTNKISHDATLVPFNGSDKISSFLTSDSVSLEGKVFEFDWNLKKDLVRDSLDTNKEWPIFSKKMSEILESVSIGYPRFEVIVRKKGGETMEYFAYQISMQENLIDMEKSEIVFNPYLPDIIKEIKKLVFTKKVNDAPQLFRLFEYPAELLIKEELANKLISAKLEGIKISPIEKYEWL
jgi:hypothetical protein